jgi:hypothetical protein
MSRTSTAGSLRKRRNRHADPLTKRVTTIEICDAGLNVPPPQKMRDLAHRLLAYEVVAGENSELMDSATLRVYEKLRQGLGEFAGVAGFQSLASRALTLARLEAPSLSAARVTADGYLQGLGELEHQIDIDYDRAAGAPSASEGAMILISRLLGLLLIFLGDASTLSLLRVSWPGAALDDSNSENGRNA